MLENRTSAVHGQVCINSLIESILEQADLPLIMLCMIIRSYSPLADRSYSQPGGCSPLFRWQRYPDFQNPYADRAIANSLVTPPCVWVRADACECVAR
jgi:hypothetical protein